MDPLIAYHFEKTGANIITPLLKQFVNKAFQVGAKKPQSWGGYFKAQFDPRAIGKTMAESVKNPFGSLSHQMGLKNKYSQNFLKQLEGSNLKHLRDYARDQGGKLESWKDMSGMSKALNVGLPVGFASMTTIPGISQNFSDYTSGRKGLGEALGGTFGELSYLAGGPMVHGALISSLGVLPESGKFVDRITGFSPRTNRGYTLPPNFYSSNYYPRYY